MPFALPVYFVRYGFTPVHSRVGVIVCYLAPVFSLLNAFIFTPSSCALYPSRQSLRLPRICLRRVPLKVYIICPTRYFSYCYLRLTLSHIVVVICLSYCLCISLRRQCHTHSLLVNVLLRDLPVHAAPLLGRH